MNTLKQILFGFAVVICLSLSAFAQKHDDQKKPPPKDPPPVVNPGKEKPAPKNPPHDQKPKKPSMALYFVRLDKDDNLA